MTTRASILFRLMRKGVLRFHSRKVQVIGVDPAHPAEHTQGCEEILWEPEVYKHGRKGDDEKFELGYPEDTTPGALDSGVPVRVESTVECHGDQASWPNTIRRINQEPSRQAC